jgi:hypothetical protein
MTLPEPALDMEEYASMLRSEAKICNASTVIVSSEILYGLSIYPDILQKIKEQLGFFEIQILIIFRPKRDFVASGFAQRVCGPQKYAGTLREHFSEIEARGILAYEQRIKAFQSVFGKDNVHIRSYNDVKYDIITPITDLTELPPRDLLSKPTWANPTKSWFYVVLSRHVNKIPRSWKRGRNLAFKVRDVCDAIMRRVVPKDQIKRLFFPYYAIKDLPISENDDETQALFEHSEGVPSCDKSVDDRT